MAQFEVYENPNPQSRDDIPYLLDVQSDLLEPLATRVVVPLVLSSAAGKPAKHLNPEFEIESRAHEDVGTLNHCREARPRVYEVRVFVTTRDRLHIGEITSDFPREGRERGEGCHNPNFVLRNGLSCQRDKCNGRKPRGSRADQ